MSGHRPVFAPQTHKTNYVITNAKDEHHPPENLLLGKTSFQNRFLY